MRFSIICPVYNSEPYLSKTLDSLCLQQFTDYEVICINDGSTDQSLEVLTRYASIYPQLKVFSQENKGPSAARNLGLSIATGEYILFCDSDDWYERNTVLAELDEYINQQNQIVDLVYFPGNTNWGNNSTLVSGFEKKQYQSGWDLLSDHCLSSKGSNLFFASLYAYAYRLEVIRHYSLIYDDTISFSEDRLFVFDFCDKAKYSVLFPRSCYFYNVRENSLMTNVDKIRKKNNDEFFVAELMINRKWSNKKTLAIKKYLSKFYLTCIKNYLKINEYPNINYKLFLVYSVDSINKLIGFIFICISIKLYKKMLHI